VVIEQLREEIAGMLLGAYASREPVESLWPKAIGLVRFTGTSVRQ
jgi:hypothetical protein